MLNMMKTSGVATLVKRTRLCVVILGFFGVGSFIGKLAGRTYDSLGAKGLGVGDSLEPEYATLSTRAWKIMTTNVMPMQKMSQISTILK